MTPQHVLYLSRWCLKWISSDSGIVLVAPWWEASQEGAELMLKYGVEYGGFPAYNQPVRIIHSYALLTYIPKTTAFLIMIVSHTTSVPVISGLQLITPSIRLIG